MPRENIVFMIVVPLVLMVIIGVIVVGIGETLIATHDWAHHALHIDAITNAEEKHRAEELVKLYPVGVALVIGTIALVAGSVASRLAGDPAHQSAATTRH